MRGCYTLLPRTSLLRERELSEARFRCQGFSTPLPARFIFMSKSPQLPPPPPSCILHPTLPLGLGTGSRLNGLTQIYPQAMASAGSLPHALSGVRGLITAVCFLHPDLGILGTQPLIYTDRNEHVRQQRIRQTSVEVRHKDINTF